MANPDIPVIVPRVTGKGSEEQLTITAGKKKLTVNTGGENLRITVRSGKSTFSVPVDKTDWGLTIDLDN